MMNNTRARSGTAVFGAFSRPERRQGMPCRRIALMLLQALEINAAVPDPATQEAIDWMAKADNGVGSRSDLFAYLKRQVEHPAEPGSGGSIGNMLLEAWVNDRLLKLATGRTRVQWLEVLDGKRVAR